MQRHRRFAQLFGVLLSAYGSVAAAQASEQHATYAIHGVVRDSLSGAPLPGVFIWAAWHRTGQITDSLGQFALRWAPGSPHLLYAGRCELALAQRQPPWLADSVLEYDIHLGVPYQMTCPESPRAPWVVDASDTSTLDGVYT